MISPWRMRILYFCRSLRFIFYSVCIWNFGMDLHIKALNMKHSCFSFCHMSDCPYNSNQKLQLLWMKWNCLALKRNWKIRFLEVLKANEGWKFDENCLRFPIQYNLFIIMVSHGTPQYNCRKRCFIQCFLEKRHKIFFQSFPIWLCCYRV